MKIRFIFFALILLAFTSCRKNNPATASRPFYMGVTPWPADFTTTAVDDAYAFINQHCDMVSHHFDEGIPYQESFYHLPWPQELLADVATRKQKTAAGKKILLSVAPLNLTRHQKADYYRVSNGISDSVKNNWNQLPVNDPKVVEAYVNYVSFLIDEFHPQWVNYGVESNSPEWVSSEFTNYKNFLSQVYTALKSKYPALPFFISFMVTDDPITLSQAAQLVAQTDYIGLSAYPYIAAQSMTGGNTDPKNLPADYFTRFIDLAHGKPWVVSETGYIAQDLSIPSFSLTRMGTAQWQADYLSMILNLCHDKSAGFFVWFCSSDYDAAVIRLQQMGLYQDLFGLWKDTGLRDENNQQRSSYAVWQQWMERKKSE